MSLIILDRDGVINHDSDEFIKTPAEWEPIDGSLEAIAKLTFAGYRIVVITNQSGIARGLFDVDTLSRVHSKMRRMVSQVGGKLESIIYCPHGPNDGCNCRKPLDGSFTELAHRLRIDLKNVPAIGDSLRDIQAAQSAGAKPILVKTGKGQQTLSDPKFPQNIPVYANLAAAVDALLESKL